MTDYLTNTNDLTTVANAIRTKGGTSDSLVFPDGFASAISAIPSGGSVIPGALRGDAELVKEWSTDFLLVADGKGTIPAYTTSETKVYTTQIKRINVTKDSAHNYIAICAAFAYPIYKSGTTIGGGFPNWSGHVAIRSDIDEESGFVKSLGGAGALNSTFTSEVKSNCGFLLYTNSSSALATAANPSYGIYFSDNNVFGSATLTRDIPMFMRGQGNYFSQTAWESVEDIRVQEIERLYRVEKSGQDVRGFMMQSVLDKICASAASASGKLVI